MILQVLKIKDVSHLEKEIKRYNEMLWTPEANMTWQNLLSEERSHAGYTETDLMKWKDSLNK